MAIFQFTNLIGATQNFSPTADILVLRGSATNYRLTEISEEGEALMLAVSNNAGQTVTLNGISLAQVTSSNIVGENSSSVIVGDNAVSTAGDDLQQNAGGVLDLVAAAGPNLDANNLLYGLGEGDIITVGAGDNLIFGGSGFFDTIDGSDTITINGTGTHSGNNRIYGNAGNDTVIFTDPTGVNKTSSVFGGLGNDDFITGASLGTVVLYGNAGNDTINASGALGTTVIYGGNGLVDSTDGGDALTGGLGSLQLFGNAGNDDIDFDDFTGTAIQTFYGGAGDDTIDGDAGGTGSSGILTLYGNSGADTIDITTHAGNVTVFGGNGVQDSSDGADTILFGIGSSGAHATLYGNAGNDVFTSIAALAAGETALILGGLGADTFNISGARSASSQLTLAGNAGNDAFNIDDSTLSGDTTTTFSGFELTDILNLTLSGGTATDLVVSGLGASAAINNGAGDGNYAFTAYTGNFTATNFVLSDDSRLLTNFGGAAAALAGAAEGDQLIAGENGDTLTGGAGDDILTGGDGADNITGGDDVDTIAGGEGNDTIDAGDGGADGGGADSSVSGGAGSDEITGGAFEDSIDGGTGNDTLAGGADNDTLTGGVGDDTFQFAIAEVAATDADADTIVDAFTGLDVFDFSDLTNTALRGTGASFALGSGTAAQALGANVGVYVATNAAASFSEANIYAALSGIADDLIAADILYVMISNNTDARLVRITEAANVGSLVDTDDTLEFIANLNGVSATELAALAAGNFADFV